MVESLKYHAIKSVYEYIMSQFFHISIGNNNLEEKQKKLDTVTAGIKAQLDAFLVGIYSPLRYYMWKSYTKSCYKYVVDRPVDLYSFLDCILDNSFTILNFFPIPLPSEAVGSDGQLYLTKVVDLLTARCPDLYCLWIKHDLQWQISREMQATYSKSFFGLKNLTNLSLTQLSNSDDFIQFFTHLGNSCPNLDHLKFIEHTLNIGMKQLLALVLGEEVDQFMQKFITEQEEPENNIHLLQFPDDVTTPICRSLIKLEIIYNSETELNFASKAHESAMAFLLRNMPNLEKLDVRYNAYPVVHSSSHLGVSRGILLLGKLTSSEPLLRPLKLVKLSKSAAVDVRSVEMVVAVEMLCPNMKSVEFADSGVVTEDATLPLMLQVALLSSNYQQVNKVTFSEVSPEFTRTALSSVGGKLMKLKFRNDSTIDPYQLFFCPQLESLVIGSYCNIWPLSPAELPTGLPFLPNLQKLTSTSCFGPWSALIELMPKPSIAHLNLYCSHFGIPESITGAIKSWKDVPDLFPNLQILSLYRADGLSLGELLDIVPRLTSLQELEIPKDLLNAEELQLLRDESSSISIGFANPRGLDIYNKNCCYLVPEEDVIDEAVVEDAGEE